MTILEIIFGIVIPALMAGIATCIFVIECAIQYNWDKPVRQLRKSQRKNYKFREKERGRFE